MRSSRWPGTRSAMKIKNIPLADILPPRLQPRLLESDPGIEELAASIERHGLISPLTVTPDGDQYRLLAGNRRFKALTMIGAKKAPCNVISVEADVGDEITMVENLLRRDLSSVEEAYAFALYLDAAEATQEQLAEKLGKERTYVTRRLMLLDLDDNSLGAIEDGIISLSEALHLRKVDDLEVRLKFLEHAQRYGCTARVMEYWVTGYLQQREAVRRAEAREVKAAEVSVPREVMMRCDRCSEPTRYNDLETVYLCAGCYRRMVSERLLE